MITSTFHKADKATVCLPNLGPVRHESAGHLSVSQSLVIVLQTGVDLGAITEQYVVQGCWGGEEGVGQLLLTTVVRLLVLQ